MGHQINTWGLGAQIRHDPDGIRLTSAITLHLPPLPLSLHLPPDPHSRAAHLPSPRPPRRGRACMANHVLI